MEEEEDLAGVWRRLAVRYAYHWECPLEEVYQWLLMRAVVELARAMFLVSPGRTGKAKKRSRGSARRRRGICEDVGS